MRTLIDTMCPSCGDVRVDVWVDTPSLPHCTRCAVPLVRQRAYARASNVIADSIPGGIYIEHGLCHSDGSPRRYDSKSEMASEARRRHLSPHVEHRGSEGSDKSTHTSRWV